MAEQLSSFASASDRNEAQKRALLSAIAEAGSAGSAAYQQAQAHNQQLQQAAVTQAAGLAGGAGQGAQAAMALNDTALSTAKAGFEADIARQGANNSSYLTQVGAATPIVESRTRATVEQMLAQAQRQREQDAMQLEQSRLALQGQRESIAGQREARAAAAAERASANSGELTAYQREQIRLAEADNSRADRTMDRADAAAAQARVDEKKSAYLSDLNRRWGTIDGKTGEVAKSGESYKAVFDIVNGYLSVDEALQRYKTPAGKPLSRSAIEAEVNRINGIR